MEKVKYAPNAPSGENRDDVGELGKAKMRDKVKDKKMLQCSKCSKG